MDVNWRAVGIGFAVTLVIGILSGMAVPFTDYTLPAVGWGLTGLVGGATAGYMAGHGAGNGALNGVLATTIAWAIVLGVLAITGTILLGAVGLALFLIPFLMLGLYAIPGAIGGALGAVLKGAEAPEVGQPAGR